MRSPSLNFIKPYALFSILNFMFLLGILYLVERRELPMPYYITLLIFSLSFLFSTASLSQRIGERLRILISSLFLASLITAFILLIFGGVLYFETLLEWGIELIASVVALSIISSTIIVTFSFARGRP
ncbi:MAG: hypothetical protein PWR09_308 [Archaeoglobi archaeon]|nr:hypothetical protein [Archaeoglobi archaeon]